MSLLSFIVQAGHMHQQVHGCTSMCRLRGSAAPGVDGRFRCGFRTKESSCAREVPSVGFGKMPILMMAVGDE